ncbi:MAG: hypothetical protein FWB80_10765 [Defluviitaleaceae bacterium]|nr:hypothetical protein [Defluviitaleaceae bacterium]
MKYMTFIKHLHDKGRKPDYIEKCKALLLQLQNSNGNVETVTKTFYGVTAMATGYRILNEYADFCGEDEIANAIRELTTRTFEEEARQAVEILCRAIIPIPEGTKIRPYLLGGLSNEEFTDAFRTLQETVSATYQEIHRAPLEWGWPDWGGLTVGGHHHNRVMRMLSTLVNCGELNGNNLILDKTAIKKSEMLKKHKGKLMLEGLLSMGFLLEEDNLTFPDTPDLIRVMYAYFKENGDSTVFSYRFTEDPAVQKYDALFLALTDKMPAHLREIHHYLYNETAKYGFSYNAHNTYDFIQNDHIWYEKGKKSKPHLLAKQHFLVYGTDKANVKMELSHGSMFKDVTLDDVKALFNMYKQENKLKQV